MSHANILASKFVRVPKLEIQQSQNVVHVRNLTTGTACDFDPVILEVLAFFERPQKLTTWISAHPQTAQVVFQAVAHAFLSDVNRMVAPLDAPDAKAIGQKMQLSELLEGATQFDTVVFGVPFDAASTGRSGARHGPANIRDAFKFPGFDQPATPDADATQALLDFDMRRHYSAPAAHIADIGSVTPLPGEGVATYGPRLSLVSQMILDAGATPAMLGGDHSCTAFALDAHLAHHDRLGIIHFDAHHDLWAPATPQFNYVTHANAFYGALQSPKLEQFLQLGLRVFEEVNLKQLKSDPRLQFASARDLQTATPEAVFANLSRDLPYYLSFDIDCLDPTIAPETGTPVPGGLSYYQAMELVDYAARHFNIVGWDIVEVGQSESNTNLAAQCGARIAKQLLLGKSAFSDIQDYARQP